MAVTRSSTPGAMPPGSTEAVPESARESAQIRSIDGRITWRDRLDHLAARWGYRRGEHRVEPGLYALGAPTADSPVCVTANYTLSFDALRGALAGRDAYLLVLDTLGINVWCAAGKGTFGTDELVRRIESVDLADVIGHRRLILPQLGASGVAAHEVFRRTRFRAEYGPVRASDLPAYLDRGGATPEMRRVSFTFWERAVLVPVELVHYFVPMIVGAAVLYLLAGWWGALGAVLAVLAGVVLFPLLLPWIPTRDFSSKGLLLGLLVELIVALGAYGAASAAPEWIRIGRALGLLCGLPPVCAYLALNFTGSTPITSPSGVKREMFRYLRLMVGMAGAGLLLVLATAIGSWIGG
jgi:hypothetical protein